jgi:hypothetical protein
MITVQCAVGKHHEICNGRAQAKPAYTRPR